MEVVYYTYSITNKTNGKQYIGYHKDVKDSFNIGIKYFSSSSDKDFINEQQTNPENFEYKILNIFATKEEAQNDEIRLHEMYDVANNPLFYNKTNANKGGFKLPSVMPEETKQKISKSHIGLKHTKETIKKLSEAKLNKKRTKEQTEKYLETFRNNHNGIEYTDYMSKRMTGKKHPQYGLKHTDTQNKKQSERMSGENNHFYGKKHTEEAKLKNSEWHTGRTGKLNGSFGMKFYWVSKNGFPDKKIHDSELDEYIADGWVKGRKSIEGKIPHNKGKKLAWVTNGNTAKQIPFDELETYLSNGWNRGRKIQ